MGYPVQNNRTNQNPHQKSWYEYSPIYAGYKWMFKDPADAQKEGLKGVQDDATNLGKEHQTEANEINENAQNRFANANQQWGSLYGPGGSMTTPGALETLYNERRGGSDAAYERNLASGLASIRQSALAHGKADSTSAARAEGEFASGLAAKSAQDMAGLASLASRERSDRLTGGLSSATGLGGIQAGIDVQTGLAGLQLRSQGDYYALDAELARIGVDPAMRQQILNAALGLANIGASVAGGAK